MTRYVATVQDTVVLDAMFQEVLSCDGGVLERLVDADEWAALQCVSVIGKITTEGVDADGHRLIVGFEAV